MEWTCPLCNGLVEVKKNCPLCGGEMTHRGTVQEYYGPYAPYEDQDLFLHLKIPGQEGDCPHLWECPSCGKIFSSAEDWILF